MAQDFEPPEVASSPANPAATNPIAPEQPAPTELEGQRTHPLTGLIQGLIWGAIAASALGTQQLSGDNNFLFSLAIVVTGFFAGVFLGLTSWLFTRYSINDEEVRIDRGLVFRSSRRIPYERLQSVDINEPLIARLVGLSELTIEMAGGSQSQNVIRFLTLDDARRLRRLLLSKAHGTALDEQVEGSRMPESKELITVVPPDRILYGALLSLDFAFAVLSAVVAVVAGLYFVSSRFFSDGGGPWGVFLAVVPFAWGIIQMINSRILAQWNFSLSRHRNGLRIERGLLSRSSQTIPYDRVQGIAVIEPVIWRRLGWSKLDVDVAGYGESATTEGGVSSNTLLPISDRMLAEYVLNLLIPDADRARYEELRPPRRSRVFAPIGWKYRSIRTTDTTISSKTGWIRTSTDVIPLHKVQSVQMTQGPLQRRLGLASAQVHTPDGPVNTQILHLDQFEARRLVFDQVERAKRARLAAAGRAFGPDVDHPGHFAGIEPVVGQSDPLG